MLSKAFELDNVLGYQSNTINAMIKTWSCNTPNFPAVAHTNAAEKYNLGKTISPRLIE
jgi:hypothetical protein